MGTKRTITVLLMTAVMITGGGLAFLSIAEDAEGYVDECITPYGAEQMFPAVDGKYMVYEAHHPGGARVVLREIGTGVERKIVDFDSYSPDISGDRVVFISERTGYPDIYEYRISSATWVQITNSPAREYSPRIDGDNIVWYEDLPGHDLSILHHNPMTGIRKISASSASDLNPNVFGSIVAWESYKPGYAMIMGYDISLGLEMELFNGSGSYAIKPDIYGDRLVFVMTNGPYELVHLYNLTTRTLIYVSDFNHASDWPRVDRDNVVYLTLYQEGWDVGLYKIGEDMEVRLTHDTADEHYPVVWGEHVAYSKNRNSWTVHYILLDSDNDGTPDQKDAFPYNLNEVQDTDGDHLGDNIDPDADNDGIEDENDAFPRDPHEWGDHDGDGVGDNADDDDDNDNILDRDDMFPLSDINPIMDLLMSLSTSVEDMHSALTDRMDDLEATLSDLMEENADEVMNALGGAIIELHASLSMFNFSHSRDMMGILENLSGLMSDVEAANGGIADLDSTVRSVWDDTDFVESFFDIFVEVEIPDEETYFDAIFDRSGPLNLSLERLAELREMVVGLQEMDEIMEELQAMSRDIEAQNDDLETSDDNMRLYFIVMIVIMAIYTVIMIAFFMRMSWKRPVGDLDEY